MSVQSEISRLQTAKADIRAAIEAKGVTVPADIPLDGYAAKVGEIKNKGDTFFLRVGPNAYIVPGDFCINGIFITKENYTIASGNIGDPYEIPVASTPYIVNDTEYNTCIMLIGFYMFTIGGNIIEISRSCNYSANYEVNFYYFNALPGETYKFYVSLD